MNDFAILARLIEAFGDRMRVSPRYYQFQIRRGATIKVRRRFPTGFEPLCRIRESALVHLPNGKELDWYLVGEDVRREWVGFGYEYTVGSEHIEAVITILLAGLDLSDDWIEAA